MEKNEEGKGEEQAEEYRKVKARQMACLSGVQLARCVTLHQEVEGSTKYPPPSLT